MAHWRIIDVREAMANRESLSHLPTVNFEYQVPGHLFPGLRAAFTFCLAQPDDYQKAGSHFSTLACRAGEWLSDDDSQEF